MMPISLEKTFEQAARAKSYEDSLEELICTEYLQISHALDRTRLQESWSWRNTHLSRELVSYLINEKGEWNRRELLHAIRLLEKNRHSLGPNRYHDSLFFTHLLQILNLFVSDAQYMSALARINRPENHQGATHLIRATLSLSDSEPVNDAHARRAALSALMTSLRQNVGSCFATAPAIMIQQEQPLQFLNDIGQMFGTGKLTRIVEGIEYTVPLSVSWGMGDLFRPVQIASLGSDPIKELAFSPGLQAALKTAAEERNSTVEILLREGLGGFDGANPFDYVTADDLIKAALLHAHGLTEEDVQEYREKPLEGIVGEIVIQTSHMEVGKGRLARRFMHEYERAKNSFKALTDNPLLKSWEFTLASLSESKADFAKWNLYASLGVQPNEPYGIGQSLSLHLQEMVNRISEELEEYQSRYDHLFAQTKYLEGRLRRASTPNELEWLRADYRIRQHELNRVLSERDTLHEKGHKLSGLLPFFVEYYGKKIRDYFQEIYDPQMHDVSANPFDDSPAGFRLLYKHGRTNPALWTMINSSAEYIQNLNAFFVATENELRHLPEMEGVEKELSELVTVIVTTIKQPEFLESSFYRLARTYQEPLVKNPLQNLRRVKRKPWAYISGGTMATLVSYYYTNLAHPKEEKVWVESAKELLAFHIDTLKELPLSVQRLYQNESKRTMLATSPTHAFLCKPGLHLLRNAWESDIYTYTWIRDFWENPQHYFLDAHILDSRMMDYLVEQLVHFIPPGYRPLVQRALKRFPYEMRANEFREHVLNALSYEKWLKGGRQLEIVAEELDSILFRCLPLFPEYQLHERLRELVDAIDEIEPPLKEQLFKQVDELDAGRYRLYSAQDLRKILKSLLILATQSTRSEIPFHEKIVEAMQKLKLAYPAPILYADTNWVNNSFGFIVNPGTGEVDFWRFDHCGSEGRPLSIWRRYFNGTDRKEWGLLTKPSEYGQFTK